VTADLTAIGGSVSQAFHDDGAGGDATAGDNVFSFQATVAFATTPGAKLLPATIADAQSRIGAASIALTVAPPPPITVRINQIQGSGSVSPLTGSSVGTRGIVTARRSNGFFLQSLPADDDGLPETSEGVFVFTSSQPTANVGDDVNVTGVVQEFIPSADPTQLPVTELASPVVTLNSSNNPLPAPVVITATMLSPNAGPDRRANLEQLERFEGMRVAVPSLTVTGPTQGTVNEANATSTSSGVQGRATCGTNFCSRTDTSCICCSLNSASRRVAFGSLNAAPPMRS